MQKIKKITTHPYTSSSGAELLFVKLESDFGIIGTGEATLPGYNDQVRQMIEVAVAPVAVGMDLSCANLLIEKLYPKIAGAEGTILRHAISGVEIAAWDALGKMLNLPVYKMLGGQGIPELPVIGGDGKYHRIPVDATEYATEMYMYIWQQAKKTGKIPVVDVRGQLSLKDSQQLLRSVEAVDPVYTVGFLNEENEPEWDDICAVARVPLAAKYSSRFDAFPALEKAKMSVVEADILESGGIGEMKLLASYAETYYIEIMARNSAGPVSAAAAAQVIYSCPNGRATEYPAELCEEILEQPFALAPNDTPGHGVRIDWSKL